jgi:hypothetical protein
MTMTFEQLQTLVESNAKAIQAISEDLKATRAIVDSNARAIEATNNALDVKFNQIADAVIRSQDRLERLERRDRRYQAEIRGLRIETRRILERWLGEPFTDDPDNESEEP